MTELTVTQVYAVGAPIILTLIFAEALISNLKIDSPSLIKHSQPSDQYGNYTLFQ